MGCQKPHLMGWQSPQAGYESDAWGGAEFQLLPSSVFEQLSDPNQLNGGSTGGQANSSGLEGTSAGLLHGRMAWGTGEDGFNAQLERMQQKPVWEPTGPGNPCSGEGSGGQLLVREGGGSVGTILAIKLGQGDCAQRKLYMQASKGRRDHHVGDSDRVP